jgi:AcrR family transcriptional regulator
MASGGVASLSQPDEHAGGIAPLYKRLPRGPHKLARDEVIRNQRTRIHGAMIEAIAQDGYEKTSITKVLALAGVSRRAFWELFANKEECFLTTFDLVAARTGKLVNEAYRTADGTLENRLRAAFEQFTEEIGSSSQGAILAEAPMAGAAGMLHLCRATATFEQMLLRSFAHAPEASVLPLPVIRGIVGGLYEVMSVRLRLGGRAEKIPALAEELLRWTLLFQTPALDRVAARACVNGGVSHAHVNGGASQLDARGRLLECVLRLTVLEDYGELSVVRIADEAGVSIDAFFECFLDTEECFLAAFDEMSDELLALTADPELVGDDWPRAVRQAIGALMCHLADHPLHAQMIATKAYAAGPDAIERNYELVQEIATLLTEGAPAGAGGMLAFEGVAGAISHTVRCQVAGEQIQRLPALTDYLTYVVLTAFIGADAAAELVTEDG